MGVQYLCQCVSVTGTQCRQHLLMFNLAGDRNGRHNLYGAPILDPAGSDRA